MKDGNHTARTSPATVIATAAIAAIVGFAAVYGTLGFNDNKSLTQGGEAAPAPSDGTRPRAKGLPTFVFKQTPEALADVTFVDATGAGRSLKDFRGKTVLLNLWATWCAPCREEMPSLDRLEKELGSDTFQVVALAVDRSGVDAARKFLDGIKVENLKVFADPTTKSGSALKVVGMPTTILIDKEGREIGRLPGPAEWDSANAKQLVREAIAGTAAGH
jgi:thiol-disulfide isomerase/thioredoxin